MNLVTKYIFFCIVATVINLSVQRLILNYTSLKIGYILALLFGTIAGLLVKYFLDKKYIFNDGESFFKNNFESFYKYSFNGIFTSLIFWGTESLFFFIHNTTASREAGAILGLTIGYSLKYRLDKRFVFQQ